MISQVYEVIERTSPPTILEMSLISEVSMVTLSRCVRELICGIPELHHLKTITTAKKKQKRPEPTFKISTMRKNMEMRIPANFAKQLGISVNSTVLITVVGDELHVKKVIPT